MAIYSRFHLPALALATTLLASCAAEGPFPSLAPRAVEAELADEVEPAPPPSDPSIAPRIAALALKAREGHSAFEPALSAARAAVAKAGAARSEEWVEAEQALSRAEAARAPTTTALADLVALSLAQASRAANPDDRAAIDDAIAKVQAIADRQVDQLDRLRASLSAP